MRLKTVKYNIDVTLAEVALWYMRRKGIDLTTGNLFTIMHRILIIVQKKNAKRKIIQFTGGQCSFVDNT